MKLDPSLKGWTRKVKLIERAHRLVERGRLCMEATCLVRARHAVRLPHVRHEVGLCGKHLAELRRGGRVVAARRLGPDDVLDGPGRRK